MRKIFALVALSQLGCISTQPAKGPEQIPNCAEIDRARKVTRYVAGGMVVGSVGAGIGSTFVDGDAQSALIISGVVLGVSSLAVGYVSGEYEDKFHADCR